MFVKQKDMCSPGILTVHSKRDFSHRRLNAYLVRVQHHGDVPRARDVCAVRVDEGVVA